MDEQMKLLYQIAKSDHDGGYSLYTGDIKLIGSIPALEEKGLITVNASGNVFVCVPTDKGRELLRNTKTSVIEVRQPDAGPYILTKEEFTDDVMAGALSDIIDCLVDDDYGANEGTEIFACVVRKMDLMTLATLPEWEG